MKQATLLAVFITVVHFGFARTEINLKKISSKDSTGENGAPNIHDMLIDIVKLTGLHSNFELKQADVLNIEASLSHGKRYILYNPTFIANIYNLTKDKWTIMTLLAHEIGHHLNGHTISKKGSSPALELEADEFAGFILHKLGATLHQSQNVMNFIAKAEASKTHPSKRTRKLAIEKGWNKATAIENITTTVQPIGR